MKRKFRDFQHFLSEVEAGRHRGTPIPDYLNNISCSWDKKRNKYVTLAEKWERHMTFKELKEKLDGLTEEQLENTVQVLYSADEIIMLELAIGMKSEAVVFIPEFEY